MNIISQLSLEYSKSLLKNLASLIPKTTYSENSFTYSNMTSHIDKFSILFNTYLVRSYPEEEDLMLEILLLKNYTLWLMKNISIIM